MVQRLGDTMLEFVVDLWDMFLTLGLVGIRVFKFAQKIKGNVEVKIRLLTLSL